MPVDHLLGDVEQAGQIGVDHRRPVFVRHLAEHDVARDAGIVDQHVDLADFGLDLVECVLGRLPVTDVTLGGDEVVAEYLLLVEPLRTARRIRAAAGDHPEAFLVQTLADAGADAAHAARYVRNSLCHKPHSVIVVEAPAGGLVPRLMLVRVAAGRPSGNAHCRHESPVATRGTASWRAARPDACAGEDRARPVASARGVPSVL
ncbi:hypothetical protein OKW36_005977 [Paraburkholderia sp. MM5482-R1]